MVTEKDIAVKLNYIFNEKLIETIDLVERSAALNEKALPLSTFANIRDAFGHISQCVEKRNTNMEESYSELICAQEHFRRAAIEGVQTVCEDELRILSKRNDELWVLLCANSYDNKEEIIASLSSFNTNLKTNVMQQYKTLRTKGKGLQNNIKLAECCIELLNSVASLKEEFENIYKKVII